MIPGSNYGYTGTKVDDLESFENTIAIGLLDESGSTNAFAKDMEKAVGNIVKSLRYSDEVDNLIYAHYHFGTNFREFHGFKPLSQCNETDYDGCYQPGGMTTLFDSTHKVVNFMGDYAKQQAAKRYNCNGIIYIITDGADNGSTLKTGDVRQALEQVASNEDLESLMTILIGVNDKPEVKQKLEAFQKEAGLTQFEHIKDATPENLAKITNFISKSVSSQSQSLGSGGPSQSLAF